MANNADIIGEKAAVRQIIINRYDDTNGHFEDDSATFLRQSVFRDATTLTSIYLPNVTAIAGSCFRKCHANVKLPSVEISGSGYKFQQFMGRLLDLGSSAFTLPANTFDSASNMTTLILRCPSVVTLENGNVFIRTKYHTNGAGGAYVYVPRDLISTYQSATNWATLYAAHSDMFRPLEDYTVDGTTTGEFDEALITTPTHPMYAVTDLDLSTDENHQRYITTTEEGHITLRTETFSSELWNPSIKITGNTVSDSVNASNNYFTIPAGSTVKIVMKNATAIQWNSVSGQRNQITVGLNRGGSVPLRIEWSEIKQAFYTEGLSRLEKSYTNTGSSGLRIAYLEIGGTMTANNTLDFGLMVLIDGVRII